MTSCLLNVAQCALKREQWFTAERVCTEVLGFLADPLGAERDQNAKALYRRAKARIGRSDFAEARADVRAAHQLEPSSRELHALWAELKEREVSANAQRDTSYSKMTNKLLYREYNVGKKKLSALPRVFLDLAVDGAAAGRVRLRDSIPEIAQMHSRAFLLRDLLGRPHDRAAVAP